MILAITYWVLAALRSAAVNQQRYQRDKHIDLRLIGQLYWSSGCCHLGFQIWNIMSSLNFANKITVAELAMQWVPCAYRSIRTEQLIASNKRCIKLKYIVIPLYASSLIFIRSHVWNPFIPRICVATLSRCHVTSRMLPRPVLVNVFINVNLWCLKIA